jgi:maltose alpha-D-glucosyltransferase/alpha-amylase
VELLAYTVFPPIGELPYLLTLHPYGFYAFRLDTDVDVPDWHQEHLLPTELPMLVLLEGWQTFGELRENVSEIRRLMAAQTREQLQRKVLIPYIESKRWYSAKGKPIEQTRLRSEAGWLTPSGNWLFTLVDVTPAGEQPQTYLLPLGIAWDKGMAEDESRLRALSPWALARVRQREQVGILYSALGDGEFCRSLVGAIGAGEEVAFGKGRLRFFHTADYHRLTEGIDQEPVRQPTLEQTNTSIFFGSSLFMKVYRRVQAGVNPELEMGLFLTESSRFDHIVPIAGGIEYLRDDGTSSTLALLQGYIENQGDGWQATLEYLERFLTGVQMQGPLVSSEPQAMEQPTPHAAYLFLASMLGRRIGELHQALAVTTGDPRFDPEPVDMDELRGWIAQIAQEAEDTLTRLQESQLELPAPVQAQAEALINSRQELLERIESTASHPPSFTKTRLHGDLHLGQVLLVENDFIIVDFEGEPARPMAERKAKGPVLRDVAGVLRSYNYAAHAALNQISSERPALHEASVPVLAEWEAIAREGLLRSYRTAIAGASSYPADPDEAESLLDLFLIEKALYEIRYELDNRPSWLTVPLAGLLQMLG